MVIFLLTDDLSFIFSIVTVLYFSVRVQKEGLNLEVLMKELGMESDGSGDYKQVLITQVDNEVV